MRASVWIRGGGPRQVAGKQAQAGFQLPLPLPWAGPSLYPAQPHAAGLRDSKNTLDLRSQEPSSYQVPEAENMRGRGTEGISSMWSFFHC